MKLIRSSLLLISIVAAVIFIVPLRASAEDGDVLVRPQFGMGYATIGKEESGSSSHVGVRIMQSANEYKKAGLEVTYLDVLRTRDGKDVRYMAAGIVLEQKLRHWFTMSIGTIGYFALSGGAANTPGVVANLGWEPDSTGRCKPFITYRVDSIFTSHVTQINSVSIGASW